MKNWVAEGIASDVNDFTLQLQHWQMLAGKKVILVTRLVRNADPYKLDCFIIYLRMLKEAASVVQISLYCNRAMITF